jgi:hypothetical protein
MASEVPSPRELVEAAQRVVFDYAYGVDDKDWSRVRQCFHDDATDLHEEHSADVGNFLMWVQRRHEAVVQAVHSMTTVQVHLTSPHTLRAESYCHLYQGMTDACQETLSIYGLGLFRDLPIGKAEGRDSRTQVEMRGLVRYSDELEWRSDVGVRFTNRRVKFMTLSATRVTQRPQRVD